MGRVFRKIATQSEYTFNGNTTQSVAWEHFDASGMSYRSTASNGNEVVGDGAYNGAPAELDPMGANVGLTTPYIQLELPPPPEPSEIFPYFPSDYNDAMYINGQRVPCTLDGFAIGCSQAMDMLDHGSALPAALAPYQHLPGFLFTSNGLGIFAVTIPGDNNAPVPPGGNPDSTYGNHDQTFTFYVPTSYSWQVFQRRRVTGDEIDVLKNAIKKAVNNAGLCKTYIRDLIEKVTSNAGLSKDAIVSTDIEALFEIVLGSRGGGDPKWGGIFLEKASTTHSAQNYWLWVGNPGFAEVNLSYGTGQGTISDRLATSRAGMSTIHELLHVAIRARSDQTNDLAFAIAAAQLAGEKPPVFSDDRPINYQASEYWGERLNQACGFPSQITNKMTNHKLY